MGGTVLFVLEPTLARRRNGGGAGHSGLAHSGFAPAFWPLAVATTLAVALYGGYFGAGIGILMISALSLFGMGDAHRVVALKNLLTGCLRGVAVLVLVVEGVVNRGYGLPMALGGSGGRLPGGHGLRQGQPRRVARSGYRDRVRLGGVLLLDAVRSARGAHWGRISPLLASVR